ncbi:hypothetical protein [Actinoplanes subtropicus]|nr:hypothetical protein [Actinoplanes subtropicus]
MSPRRPPAAVSCSSAPAGPFTAVGGALLIRLRSRHRGGHRA